LRADLASATPDDCFEVRRQIAVAVNMGNLVPEKPHVPRPEATSKTGRP
jgi:hypothetical protein